MKKRGKRAREVVERRKAGVAKKTNKIRLSTDFHLAFFSACLPNEKNVEFIKTMEVY